MKTVVETGIHFHTKATEPVTTGRQNTQRKRLVAHSGKSTTAELTHSENAQVTGTETTTMMKVLRKRADEDGVCEQLA